LELFTKLGSKIDNIFGGKKAFTQIADSNNLLYEKLYDMLGAGFSMPTHNLQNAIKEGYILNPHVFSVIRKRIGPASKIPFYLYEEKPDKKKEIAEYKSFVKAGKYDQAYDMLHKAYTMIEIKEINDILNNPNENESFNEFLEAWLGYYNLTGNAYTYGLAPEGFSPDQYTKLYTMPSQLTKIVTGNNWRSPIVGYSVDWYGWGAVPIPKEMVCHVKRWNPDAGNIDRALYGLSPMAPLCRTVDTSNKNITARKRLLEHGYPAGILSNESERGMTDPQAEAQQERFDARFGGDNQKKILLATHALKWQALGLNSVDLQLLDADKVDLATIARVYEIPTPLLLDDNSAYNNITESTRTLWTNAIIPDLSRIRDDLFNKFFLEYWKKKTGRKLYIDYDLNSIDALKKDQKLISETQRIKIGMGVMTPAQAIEENGGKTDGLPPEVFKYYLDQNLRPIDQPHTPQLTPPPAK
jgi:HK97 family phage portal protein